MPLSRAQASFLGRLESLIGATRLGPYRAAESGDRFRALARYYWNIELCKSLYPALQLLEVDLRNSLDVTLSQVFPVRADPAAYRHVRSWITRTHDVVVHPGGRAAVDRALESILGKDPARRARRTHDDLVAAMSFGFWVGMLETAYDAPGTSGVYLWPDQKDRVFPGATDTRMTTIRAMFSGLRHFRNRVFHHEPIWAKTSTGPTPADRYAEILQALRWLNSPHAPLLPRLYEPVRVLDSDRALEEAGKRLLGAIDVILEAAAQKKAAKQADRAARRAAGNR